MINWKELDMLFFVMVTFFVVGLTCGFLAGMFAGAGWVEGGREDFSAFMRTQLYRLVG